MKIQLAVIATSLLLSSPAFGGRCMPEQPGYSINCQSTCKFGGVQQPGYCEYDSQLPAASYCFYDEYVSTCHDGAGDPCCDPGDI